MGELPYFTKIVRKIKNKGISKNNRKINAINKDDLQGKAIAQHIDYVIGMDRAIKDKSAIEFAVGFYSTIGAGKDYEFAFKMGCNAIDREELAEQHIPKLLKKAS